MESERNNIIRVGSRKSELALIQTNFVIDNLKKLYPDKVFTIVSMTTLGDRVLDVSLPKIGEKSLFTKDLEDALRNDMVDFVVHSLKDLPTSLPDGLAIGAVLERDDPRDALVLREDLKDNTLETLPSGAVVGTSSLRRTAQLRSLHPHLSVVDVRGNLNTRLRKLDHEDRKYSALLLANAGLHRMGWQHRVSKVLPCSEIMYAVGQGALAVECRSDKRHLLDELAPLNHAQTYCRVLAERSFLNTLGGGCSAPVGVSTKMKSLDSGHRLTITGAVWSLDGTIKISHTLDHTFDQIKKTGKHKLSPTDENEMKKVKIETETSNDNPNNSSNVTNTLPYPIAELDRIIAENLGNCEDTRTPEELAALRMPKIFCGLTENPNIQLDVMIKCDHLGRELAKVLISKGALEVMKVTQDYIRNSTAARST